MALVIDLDKSFRLEHCGAALVRMPLLPINYLFFERIGGRDGPDAEDAYIDMIARDPLVRLAIWVSSQSLDKKLSADLASGTLADCDLQKSVAKYVARMSSRCTPFGLMATTSYVQLGSRQSHSSGGNDLLVDLELDDSLLEPIRKIIVDHCASTENEAIKVSANSTWYLIAGRLRYYDLQLRKDGMFSSKLEEISRSDPIHFALDSARDLIAVGDLADLLAERFSVPRHRGVSLVYDLVQAGILQTEVQAVLTEDANTHRLLNVCMRVGLDTHPAVHRISRLVGVAESVRGTGGGIEAVEKLRRHVHEEEAPPELALKSTLRVNAFRAPETKAPELSTRTVEIIGSHLSDLLAAGFERDPQYDTLVDSFKARFGDAEVDLLRAIDPDVGMPGLSFSAHGSSLITDLEFAGAIRVSRDLPTSDYDKLLLQKLSRLSVETDDIQLDKSDLELLQAARPRRGRSTQSATTVAASGFWDADESAFSVIGLWPTSALAVLGRFAGGDSSIDRLCQRLFQHETTSEEHAKIADIVFSPGGKITNIAHRKSPLDYEIELNHGRSRFTGARKLPANELSLYVKHGRFVLWSRRLGTEVIPRLSNAHNTESPAAPLYRFLGILQRKGWRYAFARPSGALFNTRNEIPRIRYKSLILSPRCWAIDPDSVERLKSLCRTDRAKALRALLVDRGCQDRVVRYGQFDVTSHCDLQSDIQCDALVDGLRRGKYARIMEAAPVFRSSPDTLGRKDLFVRELILPFFVRRDGKQVPSLASAISPTDSGLYPTDVTVAPFEGWLFYEIYVGESLADGLLTSYLEPLARSLQHEGWVKHWFFIRYGDVLGPHIRLRFWCGTREHALKVNEVASITLERAISHGELNSYRISPYERELRRYGGKQGMEICEELFWLNSVFVTTLLSRCEPDPSATHWLWHLWWVYSTLDEFQIEGKDRTSFLRQRYALMRQELISSNEASQLSQHAVRRDFELVRGEFASRSAAANEDDAIAVIAAQRKATVAKLFATLGRSASVAILPHLIHMDTNRFFKSQQRHHEMVMYGVLSKYAAYEGSRK